VKKSTKENSRTIPRRWLFMSFCDQLSRWWWCWSHRGRGGGIGKEGRSSGLLTGPSWSTIWSLLCCSRSCSTESDDGLVSCDSQSMCALPCLSTYDCINWSRLSRKLLWRRFETLLLQD